MTFSRAWSRYCLPGKYLQEPNEWECLVRPGRKIGVGERLFFGDDDRLQAEVVARGSFGERRIRFRPVADFFNLVEQLGHVPLPPYIDRPDCPGDRDRYQTVYARERGSVAAPTAGLHFTPEILARIRDRGIETTEITLHVGLGTFQPIRVDRVENHRLHREAYEVSAEASTKINRAVAAGRRVVAVGTTTVRTLEYAGRPVWRWHITARQRRSRYLYLPRLRIPDGGGVADKFPSAAIHPAHVGVRLGGKTASDGGLPARGRAKIQVLLLWGLYVPRVKSYVGRTSSPVQDLVRRYTVFAEE